MNKMRAHAVASSISTIDRTLIGLLCSATHPPANVSARNDVVGIGPLLSLVEGFSRAAALIIGSGSNLGGFMLSAWPAANADAVPRFIDTDRRLTRESLVGGSAGPGREDEPARHFCRLEFGSRAGLCTAHEYWDPATCSAKCLATLRAEPCGSCFEQGRRPRPLPT